MTGVAKRYDNIPLIFIDHASPLLNVRTTTTSHAAQIPADVQPSFVFEFAELFFITFYGKSQPDLSHRHHLCIWRPA